MNVVVSCGTFRMVTKGQDKQFAQAVRHYRFLLIGLLCFLSIPAFPQTGRITVVESGSNVPVDGATVIISPSKGAGITDDQGKFFVRPSEKIESLTVSVIGFVIKTLTWQELINAGYTVQLQRQTA